MRLLVVASKVTQRSHGRRSHVSTTEISRSRVNDVVSTPVLDHYGLIAHTHIQTVSIYHAHTPKSGDGSKRARGELPRRILPQSSVGVAARGA